jgi:hypothetical protein
MKWFEHVVRDTDIVQNIHVRTFLAILLFEVFWADGDQEFP